MKNLRIHLRWLIVGLIVKDILDGVILVKVRMEILEKEKQAREK
ncbi:hypothetical protein [Neobacillus endophyticus]|nr:hypothetical protein [Neobacillus endophyticus]